MVIRAAAVVFRLSLQTLAWAIANAAASAERGLIVHRESSGYLQCQFNVRTTVCLDERAKYERDKSRCLTVLDGDRVAVCVEGRGYVEHMKDQGGVYE